MTIIERIFARTEKTDGCWIWKGALRNGYGRVGQGRHKVFTTHKVVYEALVAKIPEGMVLDHLCRNRSCVNPEHLEVVTHKENINRGITLLFGTGRDPVTKLPKLVEEEL